jgi:Ca2+-binding RTX toxin-like protein
MSTVVLTRPDYWNFPKVPENQTAVGVIGPEPYYSIERQLVTPLPTAAWIVGGRDQSYFQIDSSTGLLSFISPPDAEFPHLGTFPDAYHVLVKVVDELGYESIRNLSVGVTNVVEPAQMAVSGNGIEIELGDASPSASDLTDFGSVLVDQTLVHTFQIRNTGDGKLTINSIRVPDGFTLVEEPTKTLYAGRMVEFQVRMDTSHPGFHAGQIIISTNDTHHKQFVFDVAGSVGLRPQIGDDDDNLFYATSDAEMFSGSQGTDTVSYENALTGVNVNISRPAFNNGFAKSDVYDSIENLTGSAFADALTGNAASNVLEGGLGADKLDGGSSLKSDIDTASYANAAGAVTANMLKPKNNLGEAAGDTYKNIENLLGSAFNDTLGGDTKVNAIDGGGGDDILAGNGGIDSLTGGLGADTFRFNATKDGGGATGDIIVDFVSGADSIGVLRSGFKILTTVTEATFIADYFETGSGAATPTNPSGVTATKTGHGQFLFNQTTDQLWWDEDGSGAKKALLLATFQNGAHVTASDFDLP